MKHSYISEYSSPYDENVIQEAISRFKAFYSRFDKRILTTKKSVKVDFKSTLLNISITFNKKRYSQCYKIENGKLKV